jgi:hypothetical protein
LFGWCNAQQRHVLVSIHRIAGPCRRTEFLPRASRAHAARHGGALGLEAQLTPVPGERFNTMPDERVDVADYLDAVRIYLPTTLTICG